jgi:hypothetical protein
MGAERGYGRGRGRGRVGYGVGSPGASRDEEFDRVCVDVEAMMDASSNDAVQKQKRAEVENGMGRKVSVRVYGEGGCRSLV